jgi:hypothetical protein
VKKKIHKSLFILLAGDATTVTKYGKHTNGVGRFFSSIHSKVVSGIAFQCISIIDAGTRKSFPIMAEKIMQRSKKKLKRQNQNLNVVLVALKALKRMNGQEH